MPADSWGTCIGSVDWIAYFALRGAASAIRATRPIRDRLTGCVPGVISNNETHRAKGDRSNIVIPHSDALCCEE